MAEKTYRFYIRQGEFELDLEGDQAFVESYLEAFFEGEAAAARAAGTGAARPVQGTRKAKTAGPAKPQTGGKVAVEGAALAAHLEGRKLKNHKERILAYLGFLTASGTPEFGAAHLVACFGAEKVRFPAAGRQYFQILKKQGLLAKGSRWGFWKLTEKGLSAAAQAGRAAPKKAKKAVRRKARQGAAKRAAAPKAPAKAPKAKAAPKKRARATRKAAPKKAVAAAAAAAEAQG